MGSPLYQEGPALGELTPFVNDLNANSSSRCWLQVNGQEMRMLSLCSHPTIYFSLCLTYWLHNPLLAAAALPGFAQELGILGQDKGLGKETELLLAKTALHSRQVPP